MNKFKQHVFVPIICRTLRVKTVNGLIVMVNFLAIRIRHLKEGCQYKTCFTAFQETGLVHLKNALTVLLISLMVIMYMASFLQK